MPTVENLRKKMWQFGKLALGGHCIGGPKIALKPLIIALGDQRSLSLLPLMTQLNRDCFSYGLLVKDKATDRGTKALRTWFSRHGDVDSWTR